jgi:hypothetical protein
VEARARLWTDQAEAAALPELDDADVPEDELDDELDDELSDLDDELSDFDDDDDESDFESALFFESLASPPEPFAPALLSVR